MDKKRALSLFIIAVMVLSVLGFSLNDYSSQSISSHGLKFQQTNQGYLTKIDGQKKYFTLLPDDVDYVNITEDVSALLDKKAFVITHDPNDDFAEAMGLMTYEMQENINGKYIIPALTNATGYNLPQITCANATVSQAVILMRYGNTSITSENNCIIIQSNNEREIINLASRIEYELIWTKQKTQ